MRVSLFYFFLCLSFLFISCTKDKPQPLPIVSQNLKITIQPFFDTDTLFLDSVYQTQEGYSVKFTDINFFLTDIKNGDSILNQASLYNYRDNGILLFSSLGNPMNYSNLDLLVGVDSSINHNDPSAFPNESPLNISNAGTMHWGWNPGYIFISIEGKVDTVSNSPLVFDQSFSYHIGTDAYTENLNLTSLTWQLLNNNEYVLPLKIDLKSFLHNPNSSIDLANEFITHTSSGQEVLSNKVLHNFKESISPM